MNMSDGFLGLVATTALLVGASVWAMQPAGAEGQFRGEDEGTWYHPIEATDWIAAGGDSAKIEGVLARMEAATGPRRDPNQPDTLIAEGPGHWMTEWTTLGDAAYEAAISASTVEGQRSLAKEAMLYYLLASSPHENTPTAANALDRAGASYLLAAETLPDTIDPIEITYQGHSLTAYSHVPQGDGPFPVVIISNGSDQSKEGLFDYYTEHLSPAGIAMVSVDLPGMGGSRDMLMKDVPSDAAHLAALDWVLAQDRFDGDAVFLQGSSFGGNAVARTFLRPERPALAGVIAACAPLDQTFLAPPRVYEGLPEFTMHGVKARFGLDRDANGQEVADALRSVALSAHGLHDVGAIDTPFLALNTNRDPVAPIEDYELLLTRAPNATRIYLDEAGHCVEDHIEAPLAVAWMKDILAENPSGL